jgi:hypothetical protein
MGLMPDQVQAIEDEFYDLAIYLYQTYNQTGTPKPWAFRYLSNRHFYFVRNDLCLFNFFQAWMISPSALVDPSPQNYQGFIQWMQASKLFIARFFSSHPPDRRAPLGQAGVVKAQQFLASQNKVLVGVTIKVGNPNFVLFNVVSCI